MHKVENQHIYDKASQYVGHNLISGPCPFCNVLTGFKVGGTKSSDTIPLICDNCKKHIIWDYTQFNVLPAVKPSSLVGLEGDVDRYYQEALRCIAANAPNGAATLFRKLIHQVGIYYGVSEVDDRTSPMGIVSKLQEKGLVNSTLVDALKGIKDLGDDGAHVKKNEPNMEQIGIVKDLLDSFLEVTVLQDTKIKKLKELRSC